MKNYFAFSFLALVLLLSVSACANNSRPALETVPGAVVDITQSEESVQDSAEVKFEKTTEDPLDLDTNKWEERDYGEFSLKLPKGFNIFSDGTFSNYKSLEGMTIENIPDGLLVFKIEKIAKQKIEAYLSSSEFLSIWDLANKKSQIDLGGGYKISVFEFTDGYKDGDKADVTIPTVYAFVELNDGSYSFKHMDYSSDSYNFLKIVLGTIKLKGAQALVSAPQNEAASNDASWKKSSGGCAISFKYPPSMYSMKDEEDEDAGCNFVFAFDYALNGQKMSLPVMTLSDFQKNTILTDAEAKHLTDTVDSLCASANKFTKKLELSSVNVYYSYCENNLDGIGAMAARSGYVIDKKNNKAYTLVITAVKGGELLDADIDKILNSFSVR